MGAVTANPRGWHTCSSTTRSGWTRIQLAPLTMPAAPGEQGATHSRPPRGDLLGLPGLQSDALPDKFDNRLIDAWLAGHGMTPESVSLLDRLAYMNKQDMGALELRPAPAPSARPPRLFQMANLMERPRRPAHRLPEDAEAADALRQFIGGGTSACGARAKAVVGWNPVARELIAGQFDLPDGYTHWLLKFDGVGKDQQLGPSTWADRVPARRARSTRSATRWSGGRSSLALLGDDGEIERIGALHRVL